MAELPAVLGKPFQAGLERYCRIEPPQLGGSQQQAVAQISDYLNKWSSLTSDLSGLLRLRSTQLHIFLTSQWLNFMHIFSTSHLHQLHIFSIPHSPNFTPSLPPIFWTSRSLNLTFPKLSLPCLHMHSAIFPQPYITSTSRYFPLHFSDIPKPIETC